MDHLLRINLSLANLVKKALQGKKSITLNIIFFKRKASKRNVLTEVKLEIGHVPCLWDGAPL